MKITTVEQYKVDSRVFPTRRQAEAYVKSKSTQETVEQRNLLKLLATTGLFMPVRIGEDVDIIERKDDFVVLFQDKLMNELEEEFTILTPDEFMEGFFRQDFYIQAANYPKIMAGILEIGGESAVSWESIIQVVAEFDIQPTFSY